MDVLEATAASATVTDIPCDNRGEFTSSVSLIVESSQPTTEPTRDPAPNSSMPSDSTDSVSEVKSEKVDVKKCVTRSESLNTATMAASIVQVSANSVLGGEMTLTSLGPGLDTIDEEGQSDGGVSPQCQEEKMVRAAPLSVLTQDDSLSSSDDATADTSQSSNPEPDWESCESPPPSLRRTSSASADSSTATISPSDTLAGASATDDSLSSDETALDLSQNSLESTKCLSDLESVSVSSIVRRTEVCDPIDYTDDTSQRRVSFPMKDSDLVTGYMEPANPWESANSVTTSNELISLYKASCLKHETEPLDCVIQQLKALDFGKCVRYDRLSLRETHMKPEACEALEEILKRVQYQTIDLTSCNLNDVAASAIFDMIEFYESAVELDVSDNPNITSPGFQACVSMIRKSRYLRSVTLRGNALSELHANNLGKAINMSSLHTLKLEHCGLTGRPLASLCTTLRNCKTLRELWLAHNDLYCRDADKIGELLKSNPYIQFLDVSNNNLRDLGMKTIATALIQQATNIAQDVAKAIEASAPPSENVQQSVDVDTQAKSDTAVNSDCTLTGNRSKLDALLQMQPGECNEPVQTVNTISNNNVQKGQTVEVEVEKNTDSLPSNTQNDDEAKSEAVNVQLEPISEVIPTSNSDIENTVSYTSAEEKTAPKDESHVVPDNNNVKELNDDQIPPPAEPATVTEPPKSFDLNDNNKSGVDAEALLINILDEDDKTTPSNNSKPVPIANRPTERQQPQHSSSEDASSYTTRSQSSDSLSSENSLDAMDTHLSAEIKEKITKNDTLGRQQKFNQNTEPLVDNNLKPPRGLQALILWNNSLTRASGEYVADLITSTNSLEILNIGKNTLSNDFIITISNSLKYNRTLTNLGLQSSHLNAVGIKALADVLHFGGNCTLERIDIRDNNVQVEGLMALCDALKSNKSVTQIDIDNEPKRFQNDSDGQFHYSKYLHSVRSLFAKNQSTYEMPKVRSSRKISLTCQSIHTPVAKVSLPNDTLDVKKKSGARLRSPLPSPPTVSPSSSPVLSPSRPSRFQVSRVLENTKVTSVSLPSLTPSRSDHKKNEPPVRSSPSPTSRFRVTRVKVDDFTPVVKSVPVVAADVNKSSSSLSNVPVSVQTDTSDLQFVFPDVNGKMENTTSAPVTTKGLSDANDATTASKTDTSNLRIVEKVVDTKTPDVFQTTVKTTSVNTAQTAVMNVAEVTDNAKPIVLNDLTIQSKPDKPFVDVGRVDAEPKVHAVLTDNGTSNFVDTSKPISVNDIEVSVADVEHGKAYVETTLPADEVATVPHPLLAHANSTENSISHTIDTEKPISVNDIKISVPEIDQEGASVGNVPHPLLTYPAEPQFEQNKSYVEAKQTIDVPDHLATEVTPTAICLSRTVEQAKDIPIYHPPVSLVSDTASPPVAVVTTTIESTIPTAATAEAACLKTAKPETRVRKSSWNTNYSTVEKFLTFFNLSRSTTTPEADRKAAEAEMRIDSSDNFSDILTNSMSPVQPAPAPVTPAAYSPGEAQVREQQPPSKTQIFLGVASKQFREFKDFGKQVLKQNLPSVQSAPVLLQQPQHQSPAPVHTPSLPLIGAHNTQLVTEETPVPIELQATVVTGMEETPSIIIVTESDAESESQELSQHSIQIPATTVDCGPCCCKSAGLEKIVIVESNGQAPGVNDDGQMTGHDENDDDEVAKSVSELVAKFSSQHGNYGQDNAKHDNV